MVAVFIASAMAFPPTQAKQQQWEPHRPIGETETQFLIKADSDAVIRLKCKEDNPPQRSAVLRSDGAPAALASGPWSFAIKNSEHWYFPKPPIQNNLWLVTAPGCEIERLEERVTSSGLARLEKLSENEETLAIWLQQGDVFSERQGNWLEQSKSTEEWRSRYLTLRPPGPHPTAHTSIEGETEFEGEYWTWVEDDFELSLGSRQRHRIKVIFSGSTSAACLYLDQEPFCQKTKLAESWSIENGEPRLGQQKWDGTTHSKTHYWTVITDQNKSNVSISGPALVQITSHYPQSYLWRAPTSKSVYPAPTISPAGDFTEVEEWVSLPALNTEPVFMTEPVSITSKPKSIWVDIDELNTMVTDMRISASDVIWQDENHHFSIWIPNQASQKRCTISLEDKRHTAIISQTQVHRFLWLSDTPATQLPSIEGCSGKIKIFTPNFTVQSPAQRRRYHDLQEEGLYFNTDIDKHSWLRFTHLSKTTKSHLRLEQRSGRGQDIHIEYLSNHTQTVTDDSGEIWRSPISIKLDTGWDGLMLSSESPSRARISQPGTSEEVNVEDDGDLFTPAGSEKIRELSVGLQKAPTDRERVQILERRALLLAEIGESSLALLDAQMANRLRAADQDLLGDLQSRRLSQVLYPYSTWRPKLDFWLEDSLQSPLSNELLVMAEDHPLGVAKALSEQNKDARYWWRKAITSGVELSRADALRAHQDQLKFDDLSPQTRSYFWPLRALSHDTPLYIRPKGVILYRGVWPNQQANTEESPAEALFEEAFPPLQRRRIESGSGLLVPPQNKSVLLGLHCRPKSSRENLGRCAVDITNIDGGDAKRTTLESDIWGKTAEVELPPSKLVRKISPPNSSGLLMELRLPAADGPQDRSAWQLAKGNEASFSILGPTVLRLDTWSFDKTSGSIDVFQLTDSGEKKQRVELSGSQKHEILVSDSGVVAIRISANEAIRIKAYVRDSKGGQLTPMEPPEVKEERVYFSTDTRSSDLKPMIPAARPPFKSHAQRVRILSNWSPVEINRHNIDFTHFKHVENTKRWWSAGLQIHQYVESVPVERAGPIVVDGHAGLDWFSRYGGNTFWLIADADVGLSVSEPLTAREHLRFNFRVDRWWSSTIQGLARVGAHQYGQFGEHPFPYVSIVDSPYRSAHPYQLKPELEFRWIPSPWVRVQWKSGLQSNPANETPPVDMIYGVSMLTIGAPQRWLRVYTNTDRRFVDSARSDEIRNIDYGTLFHFGHWIKSDRLLEGRLVFESSPSDNAWFVQTMVSLTRSPNGLTAIRPTQIAMRHAMAWDFDDVNNDRWGIQNPSPVIEGPD